MRQGFDLGARAGREIRADFAAQHRRELFADGGLGHGIEWHGLGHRLSLGKGGHDELPGRAPQAGRRPAGSARERGASFALALCAPSGGPRLPRVKIYTRTGDDGTTGLLGSGRVPKADARIEAYGTVDELNATIGVARSLDEERWLEAGLADVQAQLFQIGAELAAEDATVIARLDRIRDADIEALERWIDTG